MMDSKLIDEIHTWALRSNLSKEVHDFAREFSDGVLLAEIIAHFLPRYVALNTFTHVHSVALKKYNWESLQKVVFRHLNIKLTNEQIDRLANSEPYAIEQLMVMMRDRIEEALKKRRFMPGSAQRSRSFSRERSTLYSSRSRLEEKVSSSQTNRYVMDTPHKDRGNGNICRSVERTFEVNEKFNNMDDFNKDQLIENLYAKIRLQESLLAKKDGEIETLKRRVDLMEIACSIKSLDRKKIPPARAPAPTMVMDKSDDSLFNEHLDDMNEFQ